MPLMTGAQALVDQLKSEGVDTVFAVPGVQIMSAFDALYQAKDSIRLVQTRHEQTTTYMADGYAKVTGRPGVALVIPGPGALNATGGLATAYASSSPVLLISGQIPSATLGKRQGQLHEIEDQLDVFRPITKWNHRVTRVEEIPGAVHEAMRQLSNGRPRPVELEIPPDTLAATGEAEIVEPERYARKAADSSGIRQAAELLGRAESPVIIAGGGTIISGASSQLLELAENLQAPVMTTQQAKGVLPEDHYLSVGVNYSGLGPAYAVVPESDVILAVGTRFLINNLKLSASQKVIQIDIDRDEIGRNHPIEVGLEADAKEALGQLVKQLRATASTRNSRRGLIERYKQTFAEEVRGLAPRQVEIVESIRRCLNEDSVLVSGITNIGYWSNLAYTVENPRTYLTCSYAATLGFAFPTALGAKLARPDRQVVAVCGHGGFMYSPQELSTAVGYGINVVALVFNNSAYGASQWDQTHRYGGRYIGTDLLNPDFVKLAESFGVIGLRTDPEGLGDSLERALSVNAPVVVEVVLPNMMPPFQVIR